MSIRSVIAELTAIAAPKSFVSSDKGKVRSWMRAHAHEHEDRQTGEINMTSLAEAAASEFDMHDALSDEQHWIWDVSMGVANAYKPGVNPRSYK